jgi:hypothetical protein
MLPGRALDLCPITAGGEKWYAFNSMHAKLKDLSVISRAMAQKIIANAIWTEQEVAQNSGIVNLYPTVALRMTDRE